MSTPSVVAPNHIASSFHALSDPLRIRVLELLRQQEQCVCDLCSALDVTQSKLSFHLKILKEAGFVDSRHQGRWIYYSLNQAQFTIIAEYLTDFSRIRDILPAPCCKD
ncbi:metalloregulator ArsR/SmtB family transcription factor [Calothrix sp. UHCC 0171]|uniref:ArsR/SmtB family transcription factor n=1 Tax=Calothrix sp. UHCC 0171 TaxID=3110245 RepID=UPI002B1F2DDF|nr:metalloregulator ArsR/SmtB family transcription factor [Calothrix sp. UHCC 0171]MEA5571464.1 metalloregulator ArsR/SmtB family transcription factor [Calothrix sp. UHCC 0171]